MAHFVRDKPENVDPDANGREVRGPQRGLNFGESSQGEIDLMESWGRRPNRTAVHIHGTTGRTPAKSATVDDMYGKFHLCAWSGIRNNDPEVGWSFDHPMYLIMNIASGADEPAPDDSTLPRFMT